MSFSLIAPPLGVVIGFVMTSCIVNSNIGTWQLSFLVQAIMNGVAAGLVLLIPRAYLNIDQILEEKRKFLKEKFAGVGEIVDEV